MHPPNWPSRYVDKIDFLGPSDCWVWKACGTIWGYGQMWFEGKMCSAHRLALHFNGVKLDPSDKVIHSCDNRRCCNPSHLRVADQAENIRDAMRRGRNPKGETHGCHKLTETQVRSVLASDKTAKQLAKKLRVSIHAIYDIRQGRSWRHIVTC